MPDLQTVEQQKAATRARAVGTRAARYQREWELELRRRGVEVNGDYAQQRVGYASQEYKSPVRSKPTTLKDAARAFDIAMAAGTVHYLPVEGYDDEVCRQNAAERLPASCLDRVRRLSKRRYT